MTHINIIIYIIIITISLVYSHFPHSTTFCFAHYYRSYLVVGRGASRHGHHINFV